MADTLTTQSATLATVPASSVIATDDAGAGGHVQIVKLAVSTDGSATPLTADNTDGMLVNLGTNNDVTLATLPDTAAGDLAAINAAVSGTLTVGSHAVTNAGTFAVQVDSSGSVVDANNSTTTPLAGDAIFTGTGTDLLGYSTVNITLYADVDSAIDGMTFQFSTNNSDWDDVYTYTMDVSASDTRRFQFPVTARYFRVVYTNGSGAQSAFRVQTLLLTTTSLPSVHRLVDDISPDRSAAVGKSALFAQVNGTGNFTPIQANAAGVLKVGGSVDVDSSALPTGAATAANQLPDGHNVTVDNAAGASAVNIQDGGNSITVDGTVTETNSAAILADTANMDTNLGTIAGAVAGTEMQADVLTMPGTAAEAAALPSVFVVVAGDDGTDTHPLQLDASGHLQVDIAADSVGIGGGTQYTEDDAAAANPVGTTPVLVRADTPATVTSTDGDVVAQRATNYGAAFVQVLDSSGNFINTFGGSGGTSHADDAAFSIGSASSITPTGYLADETTPDSVDEGDVGVPRMTLTRKPYAVITDATSENNAAVDGSGHLQVDIAASSATVTVDGSGVTQPVSGTVTANLSATDNAVLDQIEINTSYGDSVGGGTEAAALRVTIANDSTGVISIDDNAGSITVDNAGTFAVQSAAAGDVASDSADSGNPVKVGHVAKNFDSTAPGTAVAEDDRVNSIADVYGRQLVETAHPNFWHVAADYASAQTNTTVKAAPGAGLKLYITDIVISNGATAGNITLLDGSGGTLLFEIYPAINGGTSTNLRTPIALTANTLLAITSTTVTTHSIFVSGYIAP